MDQLAHRVVRAEGLYAAWDWAIGGRPRWAERQDAGQLVEAPHGGHPLHGARRRRDR